MAIAKNGTIGVDRRFENETQLTLVLAASGETISVEAYLDRILQVISEMVAQTFDSPLCSIMILDESRQQLTIKAARYLGPSLPGVTPISVEGSVIGRVVRERQMIIVENIPGEEAFPELCLVPKFVTLLSVPLIASHCVIGALNIYVQERRTFTDEEARFARAVAGQASLAVENSRLMAETLEMKRALDRERSLIGPKRLFSIVKASPKRRRRTFIGAQRVEGSQNKVAKPH